MASTVAEPIADPGTKLLEDFMVEDPKSNPVVEEMPPVCPWTRCASP